jgi:hypothetical protein
MDSSRLFALTNQIFVGLAVSALYGVASGAVVYLLQPSFFEPYVEAYVISFNCIISGGLILGTALFVYSSQRSVPLFIEASFDADALQKTEYELAKKRYLSTGRSIRFATYFTVMAFLIFVGCRFKFWGAAEYSLIGFGCIQYAFGIYIGRKLYYIAKMLHAVVGADITRDIFRQDLLSSVVSYVNVLSTLTVAFVYVYVTSFYNGPFAYPYGFHRPLQFLLLLPAIVATPVLIVFNFYPRTVLRHLYSRSIKQEVDQLLENLRRRSLTEYERLSYVVEYDTLARDELKTRLQLSLSDLPIGLTIVLMIVALFVKA